MGAKGGGTRCPQRVGRRYAALPPSLLKPGESDSFIQCLRGTLLHRSEPDWHFREKPIHLEPSTVKKSAPVTIPLTIAVSDEDAVLGAASGSPAV
jgi:hypothetical protein